MRSALLAAVAYEARRRACRRLWLVPTDDTLPALRFHQRRGMRLVALHAGAVEATRGPKPTIPLGGHDGIRIREEVALDADAHGVKSAQAVRG